jgi:hypothetical protein
MEMGQHRVGALGPTQPGFFIGVKRSGFEFSLSSPSGVEFKN